MIDHYDIQLPFGKDEKKSLQHQLMGTGWFKLSEKMTDVRRSEAAKPAPFSYYEINPTEPDVRYRAQLHSGVVDAVNTLRLALKQAQDRAVNPDNPFESKLDDVKIVCFDLEKSIRWFGANGDRWERQRTGKYRTAHAGPIRLTASQSQTSSSKHCWR